MRHFEEMISNCLKYAQAHCESGKPIVGIMCEYTPREIILAGGGVPVCLCGGASSMIQPAEQDLPANLCPLIKSTYGFHALGSNPFLEMADLVIAETTCDGKKKMYELMSETRDMFVLELPQRPNDDESLARWESELRRLIDYLKRRWNVTITQARLLDAIKLLNRERRLRKRLAESMKSPAPPLTGRELWILNSSISGIEADLIQYDAALRAIESGELNGRNGRRPRVLLTGVPIVRGAERVIDLIEAAGGQIVCMENCTGIKPIEEDVDEELAARDPIAALAKKYYHLPCSVMSPNDGRMERLAALTREYQADCVIELVWQACLTYDVETNRVRRLAEGELGVPYLRIETDYSASDSARIAVRTEALFETVSARRGAPASAL